MNPTTIREFAASFQKSRILLTGFELGIFTTIEESGSTNKQIATALELDEHASERLLNALASLGFLTKQDSLYINTPESFTFLSTKSPDYLGGLMHTNHLWNTWSNLTKVVKTGASANTTDINERGEDWLFSFISAMHDRAKKQAPIQLNKVDLSGVKSTLDIGGGSGAYSMELVRKKPDIEATLFDLPNVVHITQHFIDQDGFSGKIKTVTGDYILDDLPTGFDLAFLSAVIHSNSLDVNQNLINKCYHSLNINGKILIQDWIMNNERTQPTSGAIFAVNMLVGTQAGDCFTEQEVTKMLQIAGFSNIVRIEFESGLSQMSAVKVL